MASAMAPGARMHMPVQVKGESRQIMHVAHRNCSRPTAEPRQNQTARCCRLMLPGVEVLKTQGNTPSWHHRNGRSLPD